MKYNVKMEKKHINNLAHRRLKNLKVENSLLSFETNDLKQLSDLELIEVNNNYMNLFKKVCTKYIITIFGCCCFLFLIITLTKTITKIEFKNKETYNEKVYQYVENRLTKVWKFSFLDDDLTNINKDIRSEFYDYQWINLEKEGTVLKINITDNKNLIVEKPEANYKSLYSKYDSIVEGYYVEKGTINVKIGHSVSKGDLLIDGHVKHYNAAIEEVEAKGYVYGKITEKINININKKETQVIRNGKYEEKNLYIVFGKVLNNPISKFESFEVEYKDVFSIGNFIVVKKMIFYEIEEVSTIYNKAEAVEYAESMIYKQFKENKKYDFEKIIAIKMVSNVENEYDYGFVYLVTYLKDLCS